MLLTHNPSLITINLPNRLERRKWKRERSKFSIKTALLLESINLTISRSHKKQTSQRTRLSFLKGKKETKNPSTNSNKDQISFQG